MGNQPDQRRRFEFRMALGQGGFGEVYLADMKVPSGLSTTVAVKVLHAGLDPSSQAVQRLLDEGKILSMLNHPAVVTVHDLAFIDGRVALVTEFVDGADLTECTVGDDPMPAGAIYEALAKIADALHAAHQAVDTDGSPLGLLHRDVKPSNVRIGKHGEAKLLDFGIATASNLEREANTGTNALIGSFPYMPPERFSRGAIGPGADFYSLGCTLYESLTGQRLFDHADMAELILPKTVPTKNAEFLDERLGAMEGDPARAASIPLLRDLLALQPADRPPGPEVVARLEDLAASVGGVRLARWARAHTWPILDGDTGPLSGKEIIEAKIIDPGEASAEFRAPSVTLTDPPPRTDDPEEDSGNRLLFLLFATLSVILLFGAIAAGLMAGLGYKQWAVEDGITDPPVVEPAPAPILTNKTPQDTDRPATTPPSDTDSPASPRPSDTDPPMGEPAPRDHSTSEEPSSTPSPPSDTDDGVAATTPTEAPAPTPVPQGPVSLTTCGNPTDLEGAATTGRLSRGKVACLSSVSKNDALRLVDRRVLGRLVLINAAAKCKSNGDCRQYEKEQPYYFEELDRSDADMMYAWAVHLDKTGKKAQTRKWAKRALGRKNQWTGALHVKRVDGLLGLDANAAYALWQADPRSEPKRLEARNAAADWATYRGQIGKNTAKAMEMCVSAAGSEKPCQARVHDSVAVGKVIITSVPAGATLLVDGKAVGTTPKEVSLSFGSHSVEVRVDGKTSKTTIDVGTETPSRWTWNLTENRWSSAF